MPVSFISAGRPLCRDTALSNASGGVAVGVHLCRNRPPSLFKRAGIQIKTRRQTEQAKVIVANQNLHRKRLAAAAGRFFVGVLKLKTFVKALARVIELGPF